MSRHLCAWHLRCSVAQYVCVNTYDKLAARHCLLHAWKHAYAQPAIHTYAHLIVIVISCGTGKKLAARHRMIVEFRRMRKRGLRLAIARLRALLDEADREPELRVGVRAAQSPAAAAAVPDAAGKRAAAAPRAGQPGVDGASDLGPDPAVAAPGVCAQAAS